jgi:hypothetical protein
MVVQLETQIVIQGMTMFGQISMITINWPLKLLL